MLVGLTGGIGSGKSTVAEIFHALNVPVINSDQITRQLMQPGTLVYKDIVDYFGKDILSNYSLDRNKIRNIIFNDSTARKWLEDLLHPKVYREIKKQVRKNKKLYYIMEIPLLLESNAEKFVDRILVIDCSIEQQIKRTMKRDDTTREAVNKIIKTQISRNISLQAADDIISNYGSIEDLKTQILNMHNKYINLSKV